MTLVLTGITPSDPVRLSLGQDGHRSPTCPFFRFSPHQTEQEVKDEAEGDDQKDVQVRLPIPKIVMGEECKHTISLRAWREYNRVQ